MFAKDDVVKLLHDHPSVVVKFKKKTTGEDRVMHCTLNHDVLAGKLVESNTTRPTRSVPDTIVKVYDLDVEAWRSFDIDAVYEVTVGE